MSSKDPLFISSVIDQGEVALRVTDIPHILFEELSLKLGLDEEFTARLRTGSFRCRKLNPEFPYVGFDGAIGYHEDTHGFKEFFLWPRVPPAVEYRDTWVPEPFIRIVAGPMDGGVWAHGRGNLMTEQMVAMLDPRFNLTSRIVYLASLIMLRANMLARNPNCRKKQFWDGLDEDDND